MSEPAKTDRPTLQALTTVLGRILALPDDLRRRLVATCLVYFRLMEESEAERRARLREGAEKILAREPVTLRHFHETLDDEIPPLPKGMASLDLLALDEQLQRMALGDQRQLIQFAQSWDDPGLSSLSPETRRHHLIAELSIWYATSRQ